MDMRSCSIADLSGSAVAGFSGIYYGWTVEKMCVEEVRMGKDKPLLFLRDSLLPLILCISYANEDDDSDGDIEFLDWPKAEQ